MNKFLLSGFLIASLASCGGGNDKAETTDVQAAAATDGAAYAVDSTSTVTWTGGKPVGDSHTGTFKVKDGSLSVKDNVLTGGNFTIDIMSLNNSDLSSDLDSKGKLEGHLKSPDFFDVAKYPTAKFEITAVEPNTDSTAKNATHVIKGNLTLRDSTKNVTFPARVTVDDKTVSASADFSIDRSDWGINYKGPNNPQNWMINKSVGIKINLTALKK